MKMKRECFTPSKHSRVCAEHFTEDNFEQTLVVRSLLGPSFNFINLYSRKTRYRRLFNYGTMQAGNWTKNDKKQMNNDNARPTVGAGTPRPFPK